MRFSLTLVILVAAVIVPDWLAAQDTVAKPDPSLRTFAGIGRCRNCHRSGSLPKKDDADVDPFEAELLGKGVVNDSWVKLDEYPTWLNQDKHSQAFTSLLNERSKSMGKLLGVDVSRDKRCLACHVGYPLSAMGGDKHLITEEMAKSVNLIQGVSCEGCHAPAEDLRSEDGMETKLKGWIGPHAIKESWRFRSAEDKWKSFGFLNVRSVSARAKVCASCHIGNASEGKIVTHEMYAAGHPHLPGFELASFSVQLPKHWRDFDQKDSQVRKQFLERNEPNGDIYHKATYEIENLHETNAALIGALVAFSESLKLSAALADESVVTPIIKPDWPELAQFDCYACHHDLKDRNWRQRRTMQGAPGRPLLRAIPIALTVLAVQHAGADEKQFLELWKPVEALISAQPFGHRESWPKVTGPLTKWLDDVALSLERKPLRREDGLPFFQRISSVAAGQLWNTKESNLELWDYDTARQLTWVAQIAQRELGTERSPQELRTRIATIQPELAELEQLFVLDLIKGRKAQQVLPSGAKGRQVQEANPEETLPVIAKYDAIVFREKFQAIARKLATK